MSIAKNTKETFLEEIIDNLNGNNRELPVDCKPRTREEILLAEIEKGTQNISTMLSDYYDKSEIDNLLNEIELTPGPQGPQGEQGQQGPQGEPGVSLTDEQTANLGKIPTLEEQIKEHLENHPVGGEFPSDLGDLSFGYNIIYPSNWTNGDIATLIHWHSTDAMYLFSSKNITSIISNRLNVKGAWVIYNTTFTTDFTGATYYNSDFSFPIVNSTVYYNMITYDESIYNMINQAGFGSRVELLSDDVIKYYNIQQMRGNSENINSYVGLQGQLVVNTDTNQIHIMDGVTPGGHAQNGGEDEELVTLIGDTELPTESKTITGAIAELFQSVSNGIDLIAAAITDKGGIVSGKDFNSLADAIASLQIGGSDEGSIGTTSNLINTNINTGIALHIPRGGTFDIDVKIDGFSEPTITIK